LAAALMAMRDTLRGMSSVLYSVVTVESLRWPEALEIPSKRFRLFVAADVKSVDDRILEEFGEMALRKGMVYFSAWGLDCERFHDLVDYLILGDDLGEHLFAGPSPHDTVMTTWHAKETLVEAVDFFKHSARPNEGFRPGSNYWVAICLQNHEWGKAIRKQLQIGDFSS
jgi:hypothetical protein